jgi:serine/threonine protein kinase
MGPGLFALEQLGAGEHTERWLAWSERHWAPVVVALPCEARVEDLRTVRHLAREGRALRRLSHPAIPRLLDDRHDHPLPHLVLEHVEGPTLDRVLIGGPLPPAVVVRLGARLAAGLHYMHGRGLVHMGLQPSGIAVHDGRPALLDLGSARAIGGRPAAPAPGAAYQAPEQWLRARPDPRMDLFSLGAILYEAASGIPAFAAGEVMPGCPHSALLVTPARARELRPGLPEELDAAIHALLERDARGRPGSAMEALQLLAAAMPDGESVASPPFAVPPPDAG